VSASGSKGCGIRKDGAIECWGVTDAPSLVPGSFRFVAVEQLYSDYVDYAGRIDSDGSIAFWSLRTGVGAPPAPAGTFLAMSIAEAYRCTLDSKRAIACTGSNDHHQLDAPAGAFHSLSAGRWHACALKLDGSIACWGMNQYGESTPPSGAFRSVSAGQSYTCGVKVDGTLVCWGNEDGSGRTKPPTGTFL
jgi:hypothetical protein